MKVTEDPDYEVDHHFPAALRHVMHQSQVHNEA
jgi:hypothetical protein